MGLEIENIIWALYIHQTQYVASFKTQEDAVRFAKTYYNTCEWHIEPRVIYNYKSS
jgi:hypothetical protein